jgi:decaprenylphospho-beta-D-erythro-pentofuranosid-2-ulose 2-reductase
MTAHLRKNFMFAKPAAVARDIVRAVDAGKDAAYIPSYWRWIMFIIRLMPEAIFKQLSL